MSRARWGAVIVIVLAALFAFQAGEYSTLDWWKVLHQEREEQVTVRELEHTVDSLTRVLHQIETDPATQERIAREQYGMVRKGEFVDRIIADSSARSP